MLERTILHRCSPSHWARRPVSECVSEWTQQATLRDPTHLLIMKPDVHGSQLRQYRMGLTSEADLVDLRAMDTAEDVIVRFVRHDMHYPNNPSGRLRLLPGKSQVE